MVLKSIIFALIAYGLTAVIAFMVAVMIKIIARIVHREGNNAAADNAKS